MTGISRKPVGASLPASQVPDDPLAMGLVDHVEAAGIAAFGPTGAAARIESSKAFAKDVMAAAGVPTAQADTCTTGDELVAALGRMAPEPRPDALHRVMDETAGVRQRARWRALASSRMSGVATTGS